MFLLYQIESVCLGTGTGSHFLKIQALSDLTFTIYKGRAVKESLFLWLGKPGERIEEMLKNLGNYIFFIQLLGANVLDYADFF